MKCKIIIFLTFRSPQRNDNVVVDAENDGADDDGRQRRFGDEGAVGHHDRQSKQNNRTGQL